MSQHDDKKQRPDGPYISGTGHLCYRDGLSTFVCECIKGPYAERVVELFKHSASSAERQNLAPLFDEINKAFIASCAGHGEPVQDIPTLTKRVKMVASSLECAETNFRVTNAAYCKLDAETRQSRSAPNAVATINAEAQAESPRASDGQVGTPPAPNLPPAASASSHVGPIQPPPNPPNQNDGEFGLPIEHRPSAAFPSSRATIQPDIKERAALLLRNYATIVRECHSSELERFDYLPEIEECANLLSTSSAVSAKAPKEIIDPPGAAVETFRRRHGRLPTKPGDHLPLADRLELAAQACHAAHLLSCEATCREAAAIIAPERSTDK